MAVRRDRQAARSRGPEICVDRGGPGSGKSALIGELLHRNPGGRILAYHCFQSTTLETLSPSRFVRSIAAMIASRHPTYEQLISQPEYVQLLSEARCNSDPESAFERGVIVALERCGSPGPERMLLVIDALDEALHAPQGAPLSVVQMLASRLQRFTPWLGLLATTRPEFAVLDLWKDVRPVTIDPCDQRNVDDVERYMVTRFSDPALATLLNHAGKDAESAARLIGVSAQGNFLYAEQTMNALASGHQLSAYFAARLLALTVLNAEERAALILSLVPLASGNRTTLDTVLSRLLLALRPQELGQLSELEAALAKYPVPAAREVAGPEPLV